MSLMVHRNLGLCHNYLIKNAIRKPYSQNSRVNGVDEQGMLLGKGFYKAGMKMSPRS